MKKLGRWHKKFRDGQRKNTTELDVSFVFGRIAGGSEEKKRMKNTNISFLGCLSSLICPLIERAGSERVRLSFKWNNSIEEKQQHHFLLSCLPLFVFPFSKFSPGRTASRSGDAIRAEKRRFRLPHSAPLSNRVCRTTHAGPSVRPSDRPSVRPSPQVSYKAKAKTTLRWPLACSLPRFALWLSFDLEQSLLVDAFKGARASFIPNSNRAAKWSR